MFDVCRVQARPQDKILRLWRLLRPCAAKGRWRSRRWSERHVDPAASAAASAWTRWSFSRPVSAAAGGRAVRSLSAPRCPAIPSTLQCVQLSAPRRLWPNLAMASFVHGFAPAKRQGLLKVRRVRENEGKYAASRLAAAREPKLSTHPSRDSIDLLTKRYVRSRRSMTPMAPRRGLD